MKICIQPIMASFTVVYSNIAVHWFKPLSKEGFNPKKYVKKALVSLRPLDQTAV